MGKQHKYRKTSLSDFFDYHEGKLTEKDRNAFERQLLQDQFDTDAAEGLSIIQRVEAEQDLHALAGKIRRRISRRKRVTWYSVAATLASILVVTTIFFNLDDTRLKSDNSVKNHGEKNTSQSAPVDTKIKENKNVQSVEEEKSVEKAILPSEVVSENPSEEISVKNTRTNRREESDESPVKEEINLSDEGAEQEYAENTKMDNGKDRGNAEAVFEMGLADEDQVDVEGDIKIVPSPKKRSEVQATENQATIASKQKSSLSAPKAQIQTADEAKAMPLEVSGVSLTDTKAEQTTISEVADYSKEKISGVILSSENFEPLAGVTLKVKGTNLATMSDSDGVFRFDLTEAKDKQIVASYVGMETEEFIADSEQAMEIAMIPDDLNLDEVIVAPEGSRSMEVRTGSVSEVSPDYSGSDYASAVPIPGYTSYKSYIDSALIYPDEVSELKKAVVILKFSVSVNGRPYNFKVIKTPSIYFSREAIRVIENGPEWIPAIRDGENIEETVRMRIVFEKCLLLPANETWNN